MSDICAVAIIDDDDAVRDSTALFLTRSGFETMSYGSGDEFLAADLPGNLGCILLDIRMPGTDGLAVMRIQAEREVKVPAVVMTGHGDIPLAVEAMQLGAVDFLEKPCDPDALVEAIRSACEKSGQDSTSAAAVLAAQAKLAMLSDRQRETLRGVMKGQPNKVIAWELGLSTRTVESYRADMLTRLGVRGTAQAVCLAVTAGFALNDPVRPRVETLPGEALGR